jgi:hypothetical protein
MTFPPRCEEIKSKQREYNNCSATRSSPMRILWVLKRMS